MLPDHYEYYYTQDEVFKGELDNIHAFVMHNYKIGMHVQEFPEINIVINGNGKHYIEENCLDVGVGDIFIIPPEVRHGYLGGEGFDVFHILIHQRFVDKNSADFHMLESYFELFRAEPIMRTTSKKPLHLRLSDERFAKVRALLSQMEEYPNWTLASDCLARSGLAMVLIPLLCKAYSEIESEKKEKNALQHSDESFMKAISKIHECYNEKLTVNDLAKIANLSRSAFVKKFTEICKLPPSEYLMKRRLEAAEYMLLNTALSIAEIAYDSGFYDASHLNKSFVREKGISPKAFRKLHS
ncbi:MAG: helix-turn-helix domain-containing protein [Ruminococcaceae bacterium]|nr:helix-turn-helix domain-containing protein [Oscillospiraceae bacterium]